MSRVGSASVGRIAPQAPVLAPPREAARPTASALSRNPRCSPPQTWRAGPAPGLHTSEHRGFDLHQPTRLQFKVTLLKYKFFFFKVASYAVTLLGWGCIVTALWVLWASPSLCRPDPALPKRLVLSTYGVLITQFL